MNAGPAGRTWILAGLVALWSVAVGAGFFILARFAGAPGRAGAPPRTWPADSRLRRPAGRPLLLLVAHPRCACTRASLEELARLLAREPGRVEGRLLLAAPDGAPDVFWQGHVLEDAKAIPGVEVLLDRGGLEARRFGVETSGHVLLYDPAGVLLFDGGITVARGHAGDNDGLDAVEALLEHRAPAGNRTPIFGCALTSPPVSSGRALAAGGPR